MVPESIGDAFAKNNLAQLVVVTLALGIGLAKIRDEQTEAGRDDLSGRRRTSSRRVRAADAGPALGRGPGAARGLRGGGVERRQGRAARIFQSLLWFIVVVLAGLACQVRWYLMQMAVFARMSPLRFLRG